MLVPRTLARSRSLGMKMYASRPAAAALAATLLARLPVEAQPTVLKPNSRALLNATDTTRSLNDSVGKLTASFLSHRFLTPRVLARFLHFTNGVPPTRGPTVGSPSIGNSSR